MPREYMLRKKNCEGGHFMIHSQNKTKKKDILFEKCFLTRVLNKNRIFSSDKMKIGFYPNRNNDRKTVQCSVNQ